MASREEQKRKLREEREAREAAERRKAGAKRRLQLVFGGLLAAAAIAAIVLAVTSGGGGDSGDDAPTSTLPEVAIPAPKITDLDEAVKAAGCALRSFPNEGQDHLPSDEATFDGYKTNPPTSGTHRPTPAPDPGVYEPGNSPDPENWVHTLEHGRILYQYKPGTPQRTISQLQTLMNEDFRGSPAYHQAVMENNTGMKYAVAAVAWRNFVVCNSMNDKVFDAFRAFREAYVDTAPERIP